MRDQSYSGRGAGLHEAAADMNITDISVGQCMFRRCVFLFLEKYISENEKTPGRPHFDKSQKGNMFSDCGAMYVT